VLGTLAIASTVSDFVDDQVGRRLGHWSEVLNYVLVIILLVNRPEDLDLWCANLPNGSRHRTRRDGVTRESARNRIQNSIEITGHLVTSSTTSSRDDTTKKAGIIVRD
jgi:hypothetical protein